MRELRYPIAPLEISRPRPLSPGASLSAKDVPMASSISWEADPVPERPRTAQLRRQPSISESICGEPNPSSLPKDIWRVSHAHYVAFSLDMAAIASTTGDPAKREALMQLQPKRYVGLVCWSGMQPVYEDGAEEGDRPMRHNEVLAPLFVASGPPPVAQARDMWLPIDPSPPGRTGANGTGPFIAANQGMTTTMDGVFEMEDEFRGQDIQDSASDQGFDEDMDEDYGQPLYRHEEAAQDMTYPGPLTAIRHSSLLPLKGRFQWLTFGTRLLMTTLHESSLSFYIDDDEDRPLSEWRRFEALVATNITALNDSPPNADEGGSGDDHSAFLEKLRVPDIPIPAVVWRDIRGGHEEDPTEFVRELDRIYAILSEPRQ